MRGAVHDWDHWFQAEQFLKCSRVQGSRCRPEGVWLKAVAAAHCQTLTGDNSAAGYLLRARVLGRGRLTHVR